MGTNKAVHRRRTHYALAQNAPGQKSKNSKKQDSQNDIKHVDFLLSFFYRDPQQKVGSRN
jgi:hypothetical protein